MGEEKICPVLVLYLGHFLICHAQRIRNYSNHKPERLPKADIF